MSIKYSDNSELTSLIEECYFNDNNGYPSSASFAASIAPSYIGQVPAFPGPDDGCITTNKYAYTSSVSNTYEFLFCLGASTGGVSGAGTHTLSPTGIQ